MSTNLEKRIELQLKEAENEAKRLEIEAKRLEIEVKKLEIEAKRENTILRLTITHYPMLSMQGEGALGLSQY